MEEKETLNLQYLEDPIYAIEILGTTVAQCNA